MASKATGYQLAVLVSDEREFDPQLGHLRIQIWRGTKAAILVKETELELANWKLSRRKWSGPGYELEATKPEDTPAVRWKIVTEMVQMDMRTNPNVVAAAAVGDGGDQTKARETLAHWIKDVDAAIEAGLSLTDYLVSINGALAPTGIDPAFQELYNLRAMGIQAYELHRPVLTRIATVTTDYVEQFILEARTFVYTTQALCDTFAVPDEIRRRLPRDPLTAPPNTVWAWKLRQQESDILLSTNRIEEVHAWVFSAWPTLLYDVLMEVGGTLIKFPGEAPVWPPFNP